MDFMNAISTVGFPIAACCVMGWFCNRLVNDFACKLNDLNATLIKLIDRIDAMDDLIKEVHRNEN